MWAERSALALFLALLVWAPLPLGSNRALAWTLLELGLYLATALWTIGWMQRRHGSLYLLRAAQPAFVLLSLWLAWLALQCIPLPAGIVRVLSPQAAALHALVGPYAGGAWVTLSVDPNATLVFWLKSCAYTCAFFLTLALAHTRERAQLIGYTLVLSGLAQAVYGGSCTCRARTWKYSAPGSAIVGRRAAASSTATTSRAFSRSRWRWASA